jgi:hypothetical protein
LSVGIGGAVKGAVAVVNHIVIRQAAVLEAIEGSKDSGSDVVLEDRSTLDLAALRSEDGVGSVHVAVGSLNQPAHGNIAIPVAIQTVECAVDLRPGGPIDPSPRHSGSSCCPPSAGLDRTARVGSGW